MYLPTGIRLLPGVRPHVILQVHLGLERFLTDLTLERLVVRMGQNVHLQVPFPPEAPPTGSANERFLPTVNHHVRLQASLAGEVLVAELALERFFVAVGPLVGG